MARKPYIGNDNWRNEPDAKKRKQIQDRLAQRARRKSFPPVPRDIEEPTYQMKTIVLR